MQTVNAAILHGDSQRWKRAHLINPTAGMSRTRQLFSHSQGRLRAKLAVAPCRIAPPREVEALSSIAPGPKLGHPMSMLLSEVPSRVGGPSVSAGSPGVPEDAAEGAPRRTRAKPAPCPHCDGDPPPGLQGWGPSRWSPSDPRGHSGFPGLRRRARPCGRDHDAAAAGSGATKMLAHLCVPLRGHLYPSPPLRTPDLSAALQALPQLPCLSPGPPSCQVAHNLRIRNLTLMAQSRISKSCFCVFLPFERVRAPLHEDANIFFGTQP